VTEPAASLSLRERHAAVTRGQILDVAWRLLIDQPQEPFSHELIAKRAGVGARTVYRHFPRRADLLQALWERVRDETKTRFPSTESEVIPSVRETFGHFSTHESVVRAALTFSAALELRSRGSLEGRPAFRRSLAEILERLPLASQRRIVAVCLGIWSAPFWQLLRDRGELSGKEAQEAGVWAMEAILNAARAEGRRSAERKGRQPARKEKRR
jgi:AcrR family transcriptional regulator